MMNKILKAAAAALLCLTCFGCSSQVSKQEIKYDNPQMLLSDAWNKMTGPEKPSITGGFGEDMVEDSPRAVDLKDASGLSVMYNVPKEVIDQSSAGATMMNAMLSNVFTASAWQLSSPDEINRMAEETKQFLETNHWLDGVPECYAILSNGKILVITYGTSVIVENFCKSLAAADPSFDVLFSSPL
ncbi:MAG: hypothetical protein HUJ54_03680 [Erysipelotrichaceae bacterium]|nr:hypothetical protein [Erysipelotrichaceae bacterium]